MVANKSRIFLKNSKEKNNQNSDIKIQDILKAKNGNKEKTEKIIKNYYYIVTSIVKKYFVPGAQADKQDLFQEGIYGLYEGIKTFDPKKYNNTNIKNFFRMCAERKIKTAITKYNRNKYEIDNNAISMQKTLYESEQRGEGFKLEDKLGNWIEDSPEIKMLYQEIFKKWKDEIIEKLTIYEIKILKKFLQGKSYKKISEELDRTKKSIDNGLQRIRKKMADIYIEHIEFN